MTLAQIRADVVAALTSAAVPIGTYTRKTNAGTITQPAVWAGNKLPADIIEVSGLEVVIEEVTDSRPRPRGKGCNGTNEITWTVRLKRHDSKNANNPPDVNVLNNARNVLLGNFWIRRSPVAITSNLVPQIIVYISVLETIAAIN